MAKAETIVKRSKGKNGEIKEITYNVNPDYKPLKVSDISMEFIINYCKASGKDAIQWLKEIANKQEKQTRNDKTIMVNTPFVTLRTAFAEKYFPDIIVGTKKKESYLDIINSL